MEEKHIAKATFGGGCFWCIEAAIQLLNGVFEVEPGYAGGKIKNPTYREVCSGLTGHAEVIQVSYNPDIISYYHLLEVFFKVHDPTTPNRQGADVGTQYRSIILTHTKEQEKQAREVIEKLNKEKVFSSPIVTQVEELKAFYPAEAYHIDYYKKNPDQPYCTFVVKPKVEKVRNVFAELLK
ncbi:MAG: peptide-methionine (S)-S-oxide reductase MsrA [Cyclobacteriaceae bacterium]